MSINYNKHNSRRKRGAQIRNLNAYKHGLYSTRLNALPPQDLAEFKEGNVEEEIQVIRLMIARHLEMRTKIPATSAEESLTDLRVISFAASRLASLIRLAKNLPIELPDSDDWMQKLLDDSLADDDPAQGYRGFPTDPSDLLQ